MDSGEASADWIDKSPHLPDIWVCCLKVLDDDENEDENGDDDDDVGYLGILSLSLWCGGAASGFSMM